MEVEKDKGHNHHRLDAFCRDSPLLWHTVHTLLHLFLTPTVFWVGGIAGSVLCVYWVLTWLSWQTTTLTSLVLGLGVCKWLNQQSQVDQQLEAIRLSRVMNAQ